MPFSLHAVLDPRSLAFDELIAREWLIANGAGGYASSTVVGLNTRKYHGLLVSAVRRPVGRTVILSRVEETVTVGGRSWGLATAEYPGAIHPDGSGLLRAFAAHPHPRWAYQGDGWTIEKSLRFAPTGADDLVITYTLLGGGGADDRAVDLAVKPLFALRGIHELSYQWSGRLEAEAAAGGPAGVVRIPATARTPEAYLAHDGTFEARPYWYLSTIYRRERERGYAGLEDLWMPGTLWFRLLPGRPVHVAVSTRPIDLGRTLAELRSEESRLGRVAAAVVTPAGAATTINLTAGDAGATAGGADETSRRLALAAGRFYVSTPPGDAVAPAAWTCLLPQFPWTALSVRDMLIALPGVLLVQGRFASARALLTRLAGQMRDGLIPSELDEAGGAPAYNACDTSLWFAHCVGELFRYTSDLSEAQELLPAVRRAIDAYRAGTKLGIGLDADGLVRAREAGLGSTWMNARVGQWVINPRHGRPVEVNALWHNALLVAADLIDRAEPGDAAVAADYRAAAAAHRRAFNARFWNASAGCCFDVAYETGGDASIRPNQLLAISLPHPVLDPSRWEATLAVVRERLLTPVGLRTLAPGDTGYHGRYAGDVISRDRAYHNGPAYPWLLGPYLSALAKAGLASAERAKGVLRGCLSYLEGAGLGLLPELFDGDPPHRPGGAVADARSVGEVARAWAERVARAAPPAPPPTTVAEDSQLPNGGRTRQLA